ncbi:hypothetical protein RFI_07365 [Reticulomyxa filosa]|uniref:Guanylate cyclase domain-containing protein n=1 Tax=Reticulomyxa filosa TaxID=46433 RepID=X6NVC3_RETFI|nr:hypothetical protein RFI_07365 [Reticulomyxa filosa]|eukprot:ETO29754.1 hypothetical protein RFI_07365 [Reticulomyxa filosa]
MAGLELPSVAKSKKTAGYVSDMRFQSKRIEMSKFTLFFTMGGKLEDASKYETAFRMQTYLKYKKITRICILGLIFIAVALVLIDPLYLSYRWYSKKYMYRNIVRFVFMVPVAICWYVYTRNMCGRSKGDERTSTKKNLYWQRSDKTIVDYEAWKHAPERIATLASYLIGISILLQTIVSQEPDQEVYMLYFFMVYLFFGIPFAFACLMTWSLVILFIVCMWAVLVNDAYAIQTLQFSSVYLCMSNALLTIAAYSVEKNDRKEYILTLDLEKEESIVNDLLQNLLPSKVMNRLKQGQNTIWDQSKECSILFSDLVSFTKWASQLPAETLIQRLHEMYSRFDKLCDVHNVYKVETIGDAYFVSSGFPIDYTPDHADRLMMLGKHMMFDCLTLDWDGYTPRMRIGIHSGPVMAGVVGRQMPRYHLFGKTVMIANELETTGVPQQLHLSEATKNKLTSTYYHLVKRPEPLVFLGETMQTYLWEPQNTYGHIIKQT